MGLFDLFGKMAPEETEEHDRNWAWSDTSKWTDTHDAEGNELSGAVIFQFESGTLCPICGLYHADQWQCDPTIPNPWGSTDKE